MATLDIPGPQFVAGGVALGAGWWRVHTDDGLSSELRPAPRAAEPEGVVPLPVAHAQLGSGHWRYSALQFAHGPLWSTHSRSNERWFGTEARRLPLLAGVEAFLIPLFGHTLGHCGVAVRDGSRWLMHVGDAYYLRVELETDDHPVSALAAMRADDDPMRRESLNVLRRIARDHGDEVELFGYHDFTEFPTGSSTRVVERHRTAVVRDIVEHLRRTTGEDLGERPEPWIQKYAQR